MKIIKIVLTGGPCAGKTTMLEEIRAYLDKNNIPNVTVPETATELILNGIVPSSIKEEIFEFQNLVMKKQLNKEEITEDYAYLRYKESDICVIIYDRGVIDNKAYLENQVEFDRLLGLYGLSEIAILDSYDLVIDLITTARCNPSVYVNSEARFESREEAIEVDKKTTEAWLGHRNLKIINSSISLEEEKNILLEYISNIINNNQTNSNTQGSSAGIIAYANAEGVKTDVITIDADIAKIVST